MHEDQLAIVMKKRKKATSPRAARNARSHRKPASRAGSERTAREKAVALASAPASFALAPECMVSEGITLKAGLAGLLDVSDSVTLDVTDLRRIDTAGVQIIAAFVREREAQGRTVAWQGSAPALTTAVELLGLSGLLKLPAAPAASEAAP
jgi:ABC-type transporter Mla MlaB component